MTAIFYLIILTATTLLVTATASQLHSSPPLLGCTDELVAISPCLGYISTEPNNRTETPTSQCCDTLKMAFSSGKNRCLCYLIKQPLIFGFPLNQSRIRSNLSSVCLASSSRSKSLESVCSESLELPPLHGITEPLLPVPFYSGQGNAESPSTTLPTGTAENSSTPSKSNPDSLVRSPIAPDKQQPAVAAPPEHTSHSSAENHLGNGFCWFLPEALITCALVAAFTHL